MPELPEVETVRVGLSVFLPRKKISGVRHDWAKSFPNAPEDVATFLIGAKILMVKRRAKVLIIELDSKYSVVVHLKMTGQLVFVAKKQKKSLISNIKNSKSLDTRHPKLDSEETEVRFGAGHPSDSLVGRLPDKSTRVILTFTDGSQLFFNDQRKFGWMRLLPTAEVPNIDFFRKLGPEPLGSDFTPAQFGERLKRRLDSTVKAALLDQTVIAGVGNIYADESLWGAKIHPGTLVKNLSPSEMNKLFTALRNVLKLSIDKGGSSDKNYVNAEGKKGSYLAFANVFRRERQPCPRCDTEIIKTRVAGRGTHICPQCQQK